MPCAVFFFTLFPLYMRVGAGRKVCFFPFTCSSLVVPVGCLAGMCLFVVGCCTSVPRTVREVHRWPQLLLLLLLLLLPTPGGAQPSLFLLCTLVGLNTCTYARPQVFRQMYGGRTCGWFSFGCGAPRVEDNHVSICLSI